MGRIAQSRDLQEQERSTFYISGMIFSQEGVEPLVARYAPDGFSIMTTFDLMDTDFEDEFESPPELAASRDGNLYGFQPIEESSERLLKFNVQTGEYVPIWEISTGISRGFSFVYTLGKFMVFSVNEDNRTTLNSVDPATGALTEEDTFDLSIIGTSLSSCIQEDVAY